MTEAIAQAQQTGMAMVGVVNTQRYGVLSTWSEAIAAQGLFGLVANTSTADATVADAASGFLGVNALSYAVPTTHEPYVVDMSTTEAPMGNLWDARRGDAPLREGAFVTADGRATDDPDEAESVLIAGGHRGLALSLLVQLLTGSLFGFGMGRDVTSMWETGYVFLAVNPATKNGEFGQLNTAFLAAVAQLGPEPSVRMPGTASAAKRAEALRAGTVSISARLLQRLSSLG